MRTATVIAAVLGLAALLTLPTLTAIGARRRGQNLPGAVVAGLFFPITWTVWYLHDEHPFQRETRRT